MTMGVLADHSYTFESTLFGIPPILPQDIRNLWGIMFLKRCITTLQTTVCRKYYTTVWCLLPVTVQLHPRMHQTVPEADKGRGESTDGYRSAQARTNPLDASDNNTLCFSIKSTPDR